jgi:hypothetical protein
LSITSTATAGEDIDIEVLSNNFGSYEINQNNVTSNVDLDLPLADLIQLVGAGGNVTLNAATISAGSLFYTLSGTGDVTLNTSSMTASDTLEVTAVNGDILKGTGTVGAGTIHLTAGGADGDVGTLGNRISTQAVSLSAFATGTGEIGILESNAVDLDFLFAINGPINVTTNGNTNIYLAFIASDSDANDINITANTGNISLGDVLTGGSASDVKIQATNGTITDMNDIFLNVQGDVVTFVSLGDTGSATDPVEVLYNNLVTTGVTPGIPYVTSYVEPDIYEILAGLNFLNGRIEGGDNIEELTTSLYGEESTETLDEGDEEEETEEESVNTESIGAAAQTTDISAPETVSEEIPALSPKTLSACKV